MGWANVGLAVFRLPMGWLNGVFGAFFVCVLVKQAA